MYALWFVHRLTHLQSTACTCASSPQNRIGSRSVRLSFVGLICASLKEGKNSYKSIYRIVTVKKVIQFWQLPCLLIYLLRLSLHFYAFLESNYFLLLSRTYLLFNLSWRSWLVKWDEGHLVSQRLYKLWYFKKCQYIF